jgi:hypothetical protein
MEKVSKPFSSAQGVSVWSMSKTLVTSKFNVT